MRTECSAGWGGAGRKPGWRLGEERAEQGEEKLEEEEEEEFGERKEDEGELSGEGE